MSSGSYDWDRLTKKYPTVTFNYITGSTGQINDRSRGFRHLCTLEPFTVMPSNWDIDVIKQFDTLLTFNDKFRRKCENQVNTQLISACPFFEYKDQELNSFVSYEEKIKGLCVVNKLYRTGREGDILFLRKEIVNNLSSELVRHVYNRFAWGGGHYQGTIEPYSPPHVNNLKKISEYLFCACFENTYHPMWSWGYMTERLFNCFKAKTIPIYIGCYNIEEYVPKRLFIDFRDFYRDYGKLSEYLLTFSKEKYIEMTEEAHAWNKTHRIGSVEDFENILRKTVGEEK